MHREFAGIRSRRMYDHASLVIYYVAVNSMTFGRPRMSEILKALEVKIAQDAPARGEV